MIEFPLTRAKDNIICLFDANRELIASCQAGPDHHRKFSANDQDSNRGYLKHSENFSVIRITKYTGFPSPY